MGQEALWLDCAEKLTTMIQNIIEFAKLIPGFMRLSQDDQVWFRLHTLTLTHIVAQRIIICILSLHFLSCHVHTDFAIKNRLI